MNSSDRSSLHATLKRTASEFREDNLSDWAAALTYYGLLALFPALIAMVSLIGLIGDPQSTTQSLTEIVTEIGPASAAETFSGPIESIASNQGAAGAAFVLGLALALWSASGYVGAFIRASNIIFETPEGRPFWKLRPLQLAVTLAMVMLMALLALGLVLTGPIVAAIADPLGFSDTADHDLEHRQVAGDGGDLHPHGRRPLLRLAEREAARLRLGHPGQPGGDRGLGHRLGGLRLLRRQLRLLRQDLRHPRRPHRAAVWFWLSNLAILFGHQLNAERERRLEIEEGQPRARAGDPAEAACRAKSAVGAASGAFAAGAYANICSHQPQEATSAPIRRI